MKKKSISIWISVIWVLVALLAVGGVTFAWFTFNPATNVEPVSSTISDGEVALLISADQDAEFTTSCVLPQSVGGDLTPVSTADLEHYYIADQQNRQGISLRFEEYKEDVSAYAIHGTFYLQSLKDDCKVYFNRNDMDFGNDQQMLAALRLGIRFQTKEGEFTYIFSLNDFGGTTGVEAKQTTEREGVVVSSVEENGAPNFVNDPARTMGDFFAVTGAAKLPTAGRQPLCTIDANEIAKVEYWLYLEGCDENCINAVQEKDAYVQLSFAGVNED